MEAIIHDTNRMHLFILCTGRVCLLQLCSIYMYFYIFLDSVCRRSHRELKGSTIIEPPHDKTIEMACAPSEDSVWSDQRLSG